MFKTIDGGTLPQAQTKHSAGYDVSSNEDVVIYPGNIANLHLGIALDPEAINYLDADFCGEFSMNFYFGIYLRSSLGLKGLYIPNSVGIIDMDYRDEIRMPLALPSDVQRPVEILRGMRVGQMILHRHFGWEIMGNMYRSDSARTGRFGSTD